MTELPGTVALLRPQHLERVGMIVDMSIGVTWWHSFLYSCFSLNRRKGHGAHLFISESGILYRHPESGVRTAYRRRRPRVTGLRYKLSPF